MSDRFYCPELAAPLDESRQVSLSGTEAHHLAHVLRKQPGDEIEIFDGQGNSAHATIVSCKKSKAVVEVSQLLSSATDESQLIVAAAVPKGDRFRWMIEKLTELGAHQFIPLQTERSIVHPGAGKMTKMEQAVIAACKQSGRNDLLTIQPTVSLKALFNEPWIRDCQTAIAHVTADDASQSLTDLKRDTKTLILIGPEGGFTNQEVEQACAQGATMISLGSNILRMETAAIAVTAWFSLGQ